MQADEIRALRRLQRIGERAKMAFPVHPHMLRHGCGYALANAHHVPGRCRRGSASE